MEQMDKEKPVLPDVMRGLVCPYCNAKTVYVDSIVVYQKSYGMIYYCQPCSAWAGVHKGTSRALGRIANYELRQLKIEAHRWFDPISREGLINEFYTDPLPGMNTRARAYHWLSRQMDMSMQFCHIGMFNEDQCRQVIAICQPVVERYENSGTID